MVRDASLCLAPHHEGKRDRLSPMRHRGAWLKGSDQALVADFYAPDAPAVGCPDPPRREIAAAVAIAVGIVRIGGVAIAVGTPVAIAVAVTVGVGSGESEAQPDAE